MRERFLASLLICALLVPFHLSNASRFHPVSWLLVSRLLLTLLLSEIAPVSLTYISLFTTFLVLPSHGPELLSGLRLLWLCLLSYGDLSLSSYAL